MVRKSIIIVLVIFNIVVCLFGIAIVWQNKYIGDVSSNFSAALEAHHIQAVKGHVASPSVVIPLHSEQDFFNKIAELNASTVYYDNEIYAGMFNEGMPIYYVFTSDMQIAYSYSPFVK